MKTILKSKLFWVRLLLGLLILANLAVIHRFSSKDGSASYHTSYKVTASVSQTVIKDFAQKDKVEQDTLIEDLRAVVANLAHMVEFGSLAALWLLFLHTWKGALWLKSLGAVGISALFAFLDEGYQGTVSGRDAGMKDIGYDVLGALLGCGVILLLLWLLRIYQNREPRVKITRYTLDAPKDHPTLSLRLAVAADLHGKGHDAVLRLLQEERPQRILIPGDLMEDKELLDPESPGYRFLRECAALAPTYYSPGNHEIGCYHKGNPWRHPIPNPLPREVKERIAATGVTLLDNDCAVREGICYCGLTSGIHGDKNFPDPATLERFAKVPGPRILLCHHPEYFVPHIQKTDIELTVCGHAHGGQWRFFGRGVYAPGQGILPKYTAGVLDGRCVISRGIGNHTIYPRIFNSPELVMITIDPGAEGTDSPTKTK